MIKHFTILVLLVMTPIASSVTGQNLNTPKHFLMPRELSHYEQLVDQDFRMFGFITSGSIRSNSQGKTQLNRGE
jgi:cytochrome c-type biogenesis protein CcmE